MVKYARVSEVGHLVDVVRMAQVPSKVGCILIFEGKQCMCILPSRNMYNRACDCRAIFRDNKLRIKVWICVPDTTLEHTRRFLHEIWEPKHGHGEMSSYLRSIGVNKT